MNASWMLVGGALLSALLFVPAIALAQQSVPGPLPFAPLLLDDFADDRPSAFGDWSLSTDRVMGGISDGRVTVEQVDGRRAMRLTGSVRLENNGGFVQNSLQMRRTMDASSFDGVLLGARAAERGSYYVFIRTSDTRMPWSYYSAPLNLGEGWTDLTLPWAAFDGQSTRRPLDPSKIRSISVVAYGTRMAADLAVDRIGLFHQDPSVAVMGKGPHTEGDALPR